MKTGVIVYVVGEGGSVSQPRHGSGSKGIKYPCRQVGGGFCRFKPF